MKETENYEFALDTIPYYPNIRQWHIMFEGSMLYQLHTVVRKCINGVWYQILCIEKRRNVNNDADKMFALEYFHKMCYNVLISHQLYKDEKKNHVDRLQISEEERLWNMNPFNKNI